MEKYKGVTVPDCVAVEDSNDDYAIGWKDGVDAAVQSRVEDALVSPEISAFIAVTVDAPDTSRAIVRDLSPRDRAILTFYLNELGRLIEEEDGFRRMADRQRAYKGRPETSA